MADNEKKEHGAEGGCEKEGGCCSGSTCCCKGGKRGGCGGCKFLVGLLVGLILAGIGFSLFEAGRCTGARACPYNMPAQQMGK